MKYIRLVVQGATNTRREPFTFTLPKLAVSEDKIDVLRRMLVVRVPDIRSEQRQADPNVFRSSRPPGPTIIAFAWPSA